jgi:hypothetical protein
MGTSLKPDKPLSISRVWRYVYESPYLFYGIKPVIDCQIAAEVFIHFRHASTPLSMTGAAQIAQIAWG